MISFLSGAASLRDMTAERVTDYAFASVSFWSTSILLLLLFSVAAIFFAERFMTRSIWIVTTLIIAGGVTYGAFSLYDGRDETKKHMHEVEAALIAEIESNYDVVSATPQFNASSYQSYNTYMYQLNNRDPEDAAMITIELENGDVYHYETFLTSRDDLVLKTPQNDSTMPSPSELKQ